MGERRQSLDTASRRVHRSPKREIDELVLVEGVRQEERKRNSESQCQSKHGEGIPIRGDEMNGVAIYTPENAVHNARGAGATVHLPW